jgi:4-hydroxythreonine-4-phosphate dehydrogenase
MRTRDPILVLTPGDPSGIGPEITWKAIRSNSKQRKRVQILCVGAREPFKKLRAPIIEFDPNSPSQPPQKKQSPSIWLLPAPEKAPTGRLLEGFQAGWSIEKATQLVQEKFAAALVTGPISKDRLQKGGYLYPGHTEFLASLCDTQNVTMMLANEMLRISLVTTHLALKDVSPALTREKIRIAIQQTAEGLQRFWKIKKPRIAVTALNPHAGESGLFGREEIETITPEIQSLQQQKDLPFHLVGPLPADTLFATHMLSVSKPGSKLYGRPYDAIVCMYHDQGLIPVKLLDFQHTVNVTLGLPMIRTSVDHGVGFDIAGKGIADPSSLQAAIDLAIYFVQKKHRK